MQASPEVQRALATIHAALEELTPEAPLAVGQPSTSEVGPNPTSLLPEATSIAELNQLKENELFSFIWTGPAALIASGSVLVGFRPTWYV